MTTNLLENPTLTQEPQGSFDDYKLPPFLREGLRRLKFEQPTPIQALSIPALMEGRDLIGQSQTGSGKTAAFAIPLLARVQRQSQDLQALVMVPTRELALQVTQVFKALAGTAVRITTIYGGAGMEGQVRGLTRGGYQIVIGTPGRLRDHLNRGTLRLQNLRMLVLDEADEMLDQGFAQDVEAIINATPQNGQRQTALFSATLPDWVNQTANKHLRPNREQVALESDSQYAPDIRHLVYDMPLADKGAALRHLLNTNTEQPIVVFARTKHGVKKLAAKLEIEGYSVVGLQGNLSQNAREGVMSAFRAGRARILVATNVGARGLDVSGVSHVINYDLPESAELFTHRVGRTGRNGASGTAITFLTGEDRMKWREIERALNERKIEIERQRWTGPRADSLPATPVLTQPVVLHPELTEEWQDAPRFQDRDRGGRFNRDDRGRGSRPDSDRPRRSFNRDSRDGGERRPFSSDWQRPERSEQPTQERRPYGQDWSRSDRPEQSSQERRPFGQDWRSEPRQDRAPRSERPDRGEWQRSEPRQDRAPRSERPDRGEWQRSEPRQDRAPRPAGQFGQDRERPSRDGEGRGRPARFDNGAAPAARPARSDSSEGFARPARSDSNEGFAPRSARPAAPGGFRDRKPRRADAGGDFQPVVTGREATEGGFGGRSASRPRTKRAFKDTNRSKARYDN